MTLSLPADKTAKKNKSNNLFCLNLKEEDHFKMKNSRTYGFIGMEACIVNTTIMSG